MSTQAFYDTLTAAGVPIFTASPGGNEYARPNGWQTLTADGNTARLAARRPDDAVIAVTGGVLTVVDVDPRNGGDIERVRELLVTNLGARVFAEIETGGKGRHFYVAGHPDHGSTSGLADWPGVDIQGAGHNVFLPGTLRPKPSHEGRGYRVMADADLAALAEGDEDGAEQLAGWLAERRSVKAATAGPVAPVWTGERVVTPYLRRVLDVTVAELANVPDGVWNNALFVKACKLGELVAGAGLPEQVAVEALHAGCVANDGRPPDSRSAGAIRSGLRTGMLSPKAQPAPPISAGIKPAGLLARALAGHLADTRAVAVEPVSEPHSPAQSGRRLVLTPASQIKPRPVRWAWDGRLALGTLALLAGREGLGKSTLGYWIAARITRGELPGVFIGQPRGVLVCATEDSWEHTIVPRLLASGADLARVFRVDVVADEIYEGLSLPRDLAALETAATEADAALLLLDPLMSRLGDNLDTHRDSEVRRALEPLVAIADRTRMSVLGLMHHNKSGSADPLQLVMGSKAFTAVARSVHTVVPDPDDDTDNRRLFGTPKNNLGRTNLPTLTYTIESYEVATDEGAAWTGRLVWGDEIADSIAETMRRAATPDDERSASSEAAEWLADYLKSRGGTVPSGDAKHAGKDAGHSEATVRRAQKRLRLTVTSAGFPRVTYWSTPVGSQSAHSPRGDIVNEPTAPTGETGSQSAQLAQSAHPVSPARVNPLVDITGRSLFDGVAV